MKSTESDEAFKKTLKNHWSKYVPQLFNSQIIAGKLKTTEKYSKIEKILVKPLEAFICFDLNADISQFKLSTLDDSNHYLRKVIGFIKYVFAFK